MLRIIGPSNNLPSSFIVDSSAEFQASQCGQLAVIGNAVVLTVSNGTAPIGLIDDVKTRAFTNISWNEVLIVPAVGVPGPGGKIVTPIDIKAELKFPNIIPSSFISTVDVVLNAVNGVCTFIAGTELNFDLTGSGTPNAIRTIVNYQYFVSNLPGDDSTIGTGRVTCWTGRGFYQVDQFETNQQYPLNANLYCSETGFLTTRKPSQFHPAVALVTAPPTPLLSFLEIFWL